MKVQKFKHASHFWLHATTPWSNLANIQGEQKKKKKKSIWKNRKKKTHLTILKTINQLNLT
jgi:hypothetical protein